jgi:FMN phosphatase YigB (HAD superfamily)
MGGDGLIQTVLFDLDGTLLHVDVEAFFPDYFARVAAWVSPYMNPKDFTPRLMKSTAAMIANRDPARTNQDVFLSEFFGDLDIPQETLMPVFDSFYREEFPKLTRHGRPAPGARAVVDSVLAGGRRAVIATSPVFPRAAIEERLRWAGLADLPFALVTHYENMHFCKPHPEYYAEIVAKLGCQPRECLMVGNDVEEDLPAQDVGIRVLLVGPNIIHRGQRPATPDYSGVLEDLPRILDGRPGAGSAPPPAGCSLPGGG